MIGMISKLSGELIDGLPLVEPSARTEVETNRSDAPIRTKEERVVRHLAASEGYEWQSDLVAEFEWSAAKTSRTLSKMEDEEQITRYRIGRQKIVCLPGQKPDFLRSR